MNKLFLTIAMLSSLFYGIAQEADSFNISGYADTYWKYDFSGRQNITTYFANDHNSISLGMIGIALNKTMGRASFAGELGFGPRGQYLSIPNGDAVDYDSKNSFHIQNLYVKYKFTDKFSMTAGYMSTFVGYEVICPASDFHYSTSYLFGAGPFQNAGIKGNYAFSDEVSLMIGIFNDWNVYRDLNGVSHVGAQLSISPVSGWTNSINFLSGSSSNGANNYSSGTLIDFVSAFRFSERILIALNAADYAFRSGGGYQGIALYPKYDFNETFSLGFRAEIFHDKAKDGEAGNTVKSYTLSAHLKHKGLILIPELRLDHDGHSNFLKSDGVTPTPQATQASIALVYSF